MWVWVWVWVWMWVWAWVWHTAKAHFVRWDYDMSAKWERNRKARNSVKHMSSLGLSPETIAPVLNVACPPTHSAHGRDNLIGIACEYAPCIPMDDDGGSSPNKSPKGKGKNKKKKGSPTSDERTPSASSATGVYAEPGQKGVSQ